MGTKFIEEFIPEEVLEHYGVPRKSGRYPWGSGENPYHHGTSSPFGRLKAKRDAKKLAKKRRAAAEKAKATREAKKAERQNAETYEERKRKAIEKGSAKDIAPFVKDMTTDELRQARNRLEEQEKFMKLVVKESPTAKRQAKIKAATEKINTATQLANSGIAGYNAFARIHNAFSYSQWPVIPANGKTRAELREDKNKSNKSSSDIIAEFNNVANKKKKK